MTGTRLEPQILKIAPNWYRAVELLVQRDPRKREVFISRAGEQQQQQHQKQETLDSGRINAVRVDTELPQG